MKYAFEMGSGAMINMKLVGSGIHTYTAWGSSKPTFLI
jgi:hypothetical protein